MRIAFIALMFLSSPIVLKAEGPVPSEPQTPQGPLLKRASVPSQWTITALLAPPTQDSTGYGSATGAAAVVAKPKAPKPRITSVLKDENCIFEKTLTENGEVMQSWYKDKWIVTQVNGGGCSVVPGGGNSFNVTDYSKTDFAGFDWVTLNNFTGRQTINSRKCLVFKDKVMTMDPQELEMVKAAASEQASAALLKNPSVAVPPLKIDQYKVEVEADIDDQTRLPVKLTYKTANGTMTRTYDFQPSAQTISIPSEVQQALDKYKAAQKRMSVPHAPI